MLPVRIMVIFAPGLMSVRFHVNWLFVIVGTPKLFEIYVN